MDLSIKGTEHLRKWADRENAAVDIRTGDMLALPYGDSSFDCVFAYHVISHTDTAGIRVIIGELGRVLKPNGEFYLTICSKESWSIGRRVIRALMKTRW
jgi:ubiquinone/menaquinone biosynthesis C-methylase UbiE